MWKKKKSFGKKRFLGKKKVRGQKRKNKRYGSFKMARGGIRL
jgi:hypothetical protein